MLPSSARAPTTNGRRTWTMARLKLTLAVLFVLTMADVAVALVLTTPAFPGFSLSTGFAFCSVTNGSTTTSRTATAVMYDPRGGVLSTDGPFTIAPHGSMEGAAHFLTDASPGSCRCTVPNRAHKCAFVYRYFVDDHATATIIPGTPD